MTTKRQKQLIEELGDAKAEFADAQERLELARQKVIAAGIDTGESDHYRVAVVSGPVSRCNYREVVDALPPSQKIRRLVKKFTTTQNVTQVRVYGRNGEV